MTPEAAQRELAKRAARARFDSADTYPASLYRLRQDILDPAGPRSLSVLGGRQSAKSHTCTSAAAGLALQAKNCNVVYVTSTYATVARMAFDPCKRMNDDFYLGGRANGQAQSIKFKNGSACYFLGADSEKLVQRLKGIPNLVAVFLDEAGVWSSDLLGHIIETVRPGLRPRAGKLVVLGNPSLTGETGTWYEVTRNAEYRQYRYTYRDNDKVPSFADTEKLIDQDLAAQFPHLTKEERRKTAYYLREYGDEEGVKFVVDKSERVYQLGEGNLIDAIPDGLAFEHHGTAGDLGVSANDALLTAGWNDDSPAVYVVDERLMSGQDSLAFAGMALEVYEKYKPLVMPVDPGGLGQKTIRTVQAMFSQIPISEAQKPPIAIQVRAVNRLLQTGRLKILRRSQLHAEMARATWKDGIVGGEINEHGPHSDLVPCLRYLCIAIASLLPDVEEQPDAVKVAMRLEASRVEKVRAAQKTHRIRTGRLTDDDIAELYDQQDEVDPWD